MPSASQGLRFTVPAAHTPAPSRLCFADRRDRRADLRNRSFGCIARQRFPPARCQGGADDGGVEAAAAPPPLRPCPAPANYKQLVLQQFDARAPRYDQGNTYHPPLASRLVGLAALQPGESVLDVGTGTGLVALKAAEAVGSSGHVTGVDLSSAMVHQAAVKARRAGLHNAVFLAADVEECAFAANKFDAILCSSTLPLLPDIRTALAQWHAWLKPGGRLAFNAPQGVGSLAFALFAQLAAQRGVLLRDPCELFAERQAVEQLLAAAGYSHCSLSSSQELNTRALQTPQQWAEAGWQLCAGFPSTAELPSLLSAGELEQMRQQYLQAAAEVAAGFATPDGIAEPYTMLWVVAWK